MFKMTIYTTVLWYKHTDTRQHKNKCEEKDKYSYETRPELLLKGII